MGSAEVTEARTLVRFELKGEAVRLEVPPPWTLADASVMRPLSHLTSGTLLTHYLVGL